MWQWLLRLFQTSHRGRSPQWPKVRIAHLQEFPECAACGRTDHLNVHHILPFHLCPEKELDPANLITLCENDTINCHLLWGHLGSWKAYNPSVIIDALWINGKIKNRKE